MGQRSGSDLYSMAKNGLRWFAEPAMRDGG
jgi:hypothetical protein